MSAARGHSSKQDWYSETNLKGLIASHGGGGFLAVRFCNSPISALKAAYPEHQFLEWRFSTAPRRFWRVKSNQRRFLDWCASQLGFDSSKEWERWYRVHRGAIFALGGSSLLVTYYHSSLSQALTAIYSELPWDTTQFASVSENHWDDSANVREFFDNTAKALGVKTLEDWYKFGTVDQISKLGGSFIKFS
jgi:hypothetical protein